MKVPVVFFGASSYVLPIIQYVNTDFNLKLVVTTEKESGTVPTYCRENKIPSISVHSTPQLLDTKYQLLNTKSPVAILADFGLLIPQSVLNIFPKGIINIHPSLLPQYRGPTPGMSAILDGKTETGISIMLLDKELDHGPLLGQVKSDIKPDDTSASLYPRLFAEGTELLKKVLPEYLEGKIEPVEQDHTKATYTRPHLTKETGYIDFDNVVISSETRDLQQAEISSHKGTTPSEGSHSVQNDKNVITPEQFNSMVRAYFPWPSLWTKITHEGRLKDKIIKFLPSRRHPEHSEGSQSIKNNISLQIEGKKPVSIKDFLNGYPEEKELLQKLHFIP